MLLWCSNDAQRTMSWPGCGVATGLALSLGAPARSAVSLGFTASRLSPRLTITPLCHDGDSIAIEVDLRRRSAAYKVTKRDVLSNDAKAKAVGDMAVVPQVAASTMVEIA